MYLPHWSHILTVYKDECIAPASENVTRVTRVDMVTRVGIYVYATY